MLTGVSVRPVGQRRPGEDRDRGEQIGRDPMALEMTVPCLIMVLLLSLLGVELVRPDDSGDCLGIPEVDWCEAGDGSLQTARR